MKSALLTGVTGFVGGAVLLEALRGGQDMELVLLARGDGGRSARARIEESVRRLGAGDAALRRLARCHVIDVDLLDVETLIGDERVARCELFVHGAALASFANNPAIYPTNVQATLALGRLARQGGCRRFMFVSTAMACGPALDPAGCVSEQDRLPTDRAEHLVPYTHSKALAEEGLREVLAGGPELVVLRPSIVVGHTQLGCEPSQSIAWVFRVALDLGAFTVDLGDRIDVVPVDWCAHAVWTLACKDALSHSTYHLSAGRTRASSFAEIDQAMAQARERAPVAPNYRRVERKDLGQLLPRMRELVGQGHDRLLARALKLYGAFAELQYLFANERLAAEGVPLPPRFSDYAGLCALSLDKVPLATQMRWDFK